MARITIPDENRQLEETDQIEAFLKPFGIRYERWDVEGRIEADASNEEILEAYAPEVDRLKGAGGFVTADVIHVTPETPGLEAILKKFKQEHTHSEDEVRFVVKGSGVFHIHPEEGPVFGIQVDAGDLINVPAGVRHWFNLCDDHTIRCIRLFRDPAGWVAHYVDNGVDGNYTPLCWGPNYIQPASKVEPVVKP